MVGRVAVYPYSIQQLQELIADVSESSAELIGQKLHYHYFNGYCDDIGVKTLIIEFEYVDRDYLEDFAAYYVRCFHPYNRYCTRIHFFKEIITQQEFDDCISGNDDQNIIEHKLKNNYQGFAVIKPLPQTVIGRTCLQHYENEGRRYYPIAREYKANLCGIELNVDSLAFQEQDRVLAACATSALWSVFHGTGKEFQHNIPSPVEITRAATEKLPIETRTLPNHGLSTPMMAHAIKHVGLEPFQISVKNDYILKGTIYAYLRGRIPMILGIELWDTSTDEHKLKGYHAVAVTGFSLGGEDTVPFGNTNFLLFASQIDKLYVHDDQVGPFAKMQFNKDHDGNPLPPDYISTSWIGEDRRIGSVLARPTILLIPIYHKIRIPFDIIHDAVMSFDSVLEVLRQDFNIAYSGQLEWDIFLTTNNDLKKEIKNKKTATGEYFKEVLLDGMPKFLWRATAISNGNAVLDLLFDATDIEQGELFNRAIEYEEDLSLFLRVISKLDIKSRLDEIMDLLDLEKERKIIEKILEWFEKQPLPDMPDVEGAED